MFDSVRNNPKLVQVFLLIITVPFALWGVDAYVRDSSSDNVVATVGGSRISVEQFQTALGEQRDRMRASLGGQFDPAMLDNPEVRAALLDNLVNQRLLVLYASDSRMGVSNEQLAAFLARVPELQVDGKFSVARFEQLAAAQGTNKIGLENRIRQEMLMRMTTAAVVEGSLHKVQAQSDQWLAAALEAREISQIVLRPEDFNKQVQLAPEAAKQFYDANPDKFKLPEQLRFEFAVLSQSAMAQAAAVSDAEIKAWYEAHAERYKQAEERRASHILIMADKDNTAQAEAKARDLLAQVRKNPADFARLARLHSQDPGSAKQGGELGVVTRGVMVKPFEDAVFSLKDKEISDLVRTEYGFHIIRLDNLKGGGVKPLSVARAEIEAELKTQQASKQYVEAAEGFSNMVYEQADSLAPAAEKYGIKIQQGPWIAKGRPVQGLSEKVLAALFSDDAIQNKRNTEVVEIAPNTLMAARVVEHKPAAVVPFAEVQAAIERQIRHEEAAKLAAKEAGERLSRLKAGESAGTWGAARIFSRAEASGSGLGREAMHAVFKLDPAALPGYASAAQPDGSTVLYRVSKVVPFVAGKDDGQVTGLRQQYVEMASQVDFSAWLRSLRERYKVTVNTSLLQKEGQR